MSESGAPPEESARAIFDIVEGARGRQASDVHLDPWEGVAFRAFSKIERLPDVRVTAGAARAFVMETFDALARARLERLGAAECAYAGPQIGSVRINASKARDTFRLSIRLLPATLPDLETLLPANAVAALSRARPGLAIVSGPSASGKTTATFALLSRLAARSPIQIVTVERALEHRLSWQRAIVSQCEVGRDLATFGDGVRSASRSGADVIFAGELIELDTLEACLEAAENGRFVLAALAGPSETSHALARLIGFFPSDEQERGRERLAGAIRCIVGLRLVATRQNDGLRAAAEVFLVDEEPARRLVRHAAVHEIRAYIARHNRSGNETLEASLSALVAEGSVELAVARAASLYPGEVSGSHLALRA